jgi:hypothetical protein
MITVKSNQKFLNYKYIDFKNCKIFTALFYKRNMVIFSYL